MELKGKSGLLPVFLFLLLVTSCGYKFAGSGRLPGNVTKVYVQNLENRTAETNIDTVFTNDLIFEFTQNGVEVAGKREDAEAVLYGSIDSLTLGTISRKGESASLERRVEIKVTLYLRERGGKVLRSIKGMGDNEAYPVTSDKMETEDSRRDAIAVLSKRMAESAYGRMTEDF